MQRELAAFYRAMIASLSLTVSALFGVPEKVRSLSHHESTTYGGADLPDHHGIASLPRKVPSLGAMAQA